MITTTGLTKRYPGSLALDDVGIQVPAGVVYGLVGRNGAGKTTLLSILAGLRAPTSGAVAIDAPPSAVAVLPDTPRFDPWLTGREVVALAGRLAETPVDEARIAEVIADAGIADAADRRAGGYSRGMLQRLGIAATVVGSPAVLLMDEPASALDPQGRREVLDLVRRLRGSATVVVSSHILNDVQEVSDWIGILDHGRLRYQGPVADLLRNHAGPVYRIQVRSDRDGAADALAPLGWVRDVEPIGDRGLRVKVASLDEAERGLVVALAGAGVPVISIEPDAPSLEDVFLEVTR